MTDTSREEQLAILAEDRKREARHQTKRALIGVAIIVGIVVVIAVLFLIRRNL